MLSRPSHYNSRYKHDLSPRQRDVLGLMAAGRTNAEIAEELGLSLDGAKWHVREVLGKLGMESREEAAEWWLRYNRPAARMGRTLAGLANMGFWKVSAVAGGGVALAAAGVLGVLTFTGGFSGAGETSSRESLPECENYNLRTSTREEDAGGSIRITLEVTLRAPDWYEGFFHRLGRDRHVESPCLMDGEIAVSLHQFGELTGPRPEGRPAPIVPLSLLAEVSGNPAAVPVHAAVETGKKIDVVVVEFTNWCREADILGVEFHIPEAREPNIWLLLPAQFAQLPDCVAPGAAATLSARAVAPGQ